MALTWQQHQQNIFGGESGGDYDALFGYQNRAGGKFEGIKVSEMPIADVLRFTSPSGAYGKYVAGARPDPEMGVATPVGAYQVVGSTLRRAVDALGLDPSQKFDKETQDKIGQWILKTQGTGAWQGYGKGGATMDQQPAQMMQQPQERQGLLAGLLGGQGLGERLGMSQDFADKLAMAVMAGTGDARMQPLIAQRAASMQERKAEEKETKQRNKSIEYLQSRADAGDVTAKEILGAVSTGVLPVGTGISTYLTESLATEKDTRTQRQKDYEYASNVLKLPQDQAIQWAKSGTTVNVGGEADDFSKALMKEQAKRYETYQDAAGSARAVMENLDIMSSIVGQPDFYSGFGAETLNKAKRAAIAFGADPEGVKNAETFIKIAKDSALQAMGGSLGVGFSNADREFVEAMVPNIGNTVEGNKLIIETQKRIQNRKIELAMFAEQYAAKNGNLSGFTAAVKDWAAQNPMFTEDEKQQLFGGVVAPNSTGLSDEASSFLKKKE